MATLPNTGTVQYNGVSFLAGYKTRISATPAPDDAGRATKYVEYEIEVDGYITAASGSTTDGTLKSLRQALTQPAGALVIQSKGFGDLVANSSLSNAKDVAWGPWPEVLEWVPIGNDQTAKVTWKCKVRLPECSSQGQTRYQGPFVQFVYEVDWSIDGDGYTVVKTSGFLEIAMTRTAQGAHTPPDSADNYRANASPAVPLGFQRTAQDFKLSKDRRRLDFSITDAQLPTALPQNVTKIEASHHVESGIGHGEGAFQIWTITIEATITLAAGRPKTDAWNAFLLVLASRTRGHKGTLMLYRVEVSEDIFGRTSRFSATMRSKETQSLQEILNASGMWTPIQGTSHALWQQSVAPYTGERGQAGLKYPASLDYIVDLCSTAPVTRNPQGQSPVLRAGARPAFANDTLLKNLSADNSWDDYVCWMEYDEDSGVVVKKPLPGSSVILKAAQPGTPPSVIFGGLSDLPGVAARPGYKAFPQDLYQQASSPTRKLRLKGYAVRLSYRIAAPQLLTAGGVQVVELSRNVQEGVVGAYAGVPLFMTTWNIEYSVPGPCNIVEYQANPAENVLKATDGPKNPEAG